MTEPDTKQVSTEFINYLKSTENKPQLKPQPFKQKLPLMDSSNHTQQYHGPVQGDFSKISQTYILQNDKLKVKDPIYRKTNPFQMHNQKYEEAQEPIYPKENVVPRPTSKYQETEDQIDIQLIKQIAKLQHLEKTRYIKPEEAQRLQFLRASKYPPQIEEPMEIPKQRTGKQVKSNKKNSQIMSEIKPQMMPFEMDLQNMDPNMYYQNSWMEQKSQFGQPVYNLSQFTAQKNPHSIMNYQEKPLYFGKNYQMNYSQGMHRNQIDPRYNPFY